MCFMRIYEKNMMFIRRICVSLGLLLIVMINTIFFEQAYSTRFDGIIFFPAMFIAISLYFASIYVYNLYYMILLFVLFYTIVILGVLRIEHLFSGFKFHVRTFQETSRSQPMTYKEVDVFWSNLCWFPFMAMQIVTLALRSSVYAKVQRMYVFFAMNVMSMYYDSFLSYTYPSLHRYLFWSMEFSLYFLFSVFFLMVGAGIADILYHKKNQLYLELFLLYVGIFFWLLSMLLRCISYAR